MEGETDKKVSQILKKRKREGKFSKREGHQGRS